MKLSLKSIARFTRQMSTYQDSFVDLRKAIASLSQGTSDPRLSASLRRVGERVKEGDSLFEAFNAEGDRYPLIFLRMTKVGEESGTLAEIYKTLADYFEQQLATRNRFIAQLIYPCFMVAALVLVHSLITAVFSGIKEMGADWARIQQVFVQTLLTDVGIIAAIVGGILLVRVAVVGRGLTDMLILYIPPLRGPFRKLMLSRFSLSMYLMTGSAIGMPEAVAESGKATGNSFVAGLCERGAEEIRQGTPLTPVLSSMGIFPRDFIDIVDVAEESGTISESLRRVSIHYAEAADTSMRRLVSGLAWGIYLFIGGIMAYYIITLYAGYISNITNLTNEIH
jgi:type IV pilus assembly protein PilC